MIEEKRNKIFHVIITVECLKMYYFSFNKLYRYLHVYYITIAYNIMIDSFLTWYTLSGTLCTSRDNNRKSYQPT